MTRIQKKNMATSLTAVVFLIVGTSGIMMFFHIFDDYTKVLHEIFGLFFTVVVGFHVLYNWSSMKSYFNKKVFLISSIFVLVIGLVFILNSEEDEKIKIIKVVVYAPIESAVNTLGSDIKTVKIKFENEGIKFENEKSINEIATNNDLSPLEIIDVIITK